MNIEDKNQAFISYMMDTAKSVLRDEIDVNHYVDAVLCDLWDGSAYGDHYYEFPKCDTKDRNPHVVSI